MLGIWMKSTLRQDVVSPIKAYLSSKYPAADVAKQTDAIEAFQTLRNHVADIKDATDGARLALKEYVAQLGGMAAKVPVAEASGARIQFKWSDGFVPSSTVAQYSLPLERAAALYNLASIESQMAVAVERNTQAGLDAARAQFCAAAGILSYVRDTVVGQIVGSLPLDCTTDGLNLYINLMLAQAQSVYYEAARSKGMKPETLSKLAGGAAELYRAAAKGFSGPLREAVEGAFPWHTHCEVWAITFDAACFNHYAEKMGETAATTGDGYGEQIAWLTAAELACGKAMEVKRAAAARYKAAAGVSTATVESLLKVLREKKAACEDENRRIYFQLPPKLAELPALPRAVMAKPAAFVEPTPAALGARDLFAGIVPPEVAAAMGQLDDRLAALTAAAREKAAKAAEDARAALAAMGLPGYLDAAGGSAAAQGVPQGVWDRVHVCQVEGGPAELDRLWSANNYAAGGARDVLRQVGAVLDEERAGYDSMRARYGARWTATPSEVITADCRADLDKFTAVADAAGASDGAVRAMLEGYRPLLARLNASRAELDASMPAGYAPAPDAGGEAAGMLAELRSAVDSLNKLLAARLTLVANIRDTFDRAAAAAVLARAVAGAPGEVPAAIEGLLQRTEPAMRALQDSADAQTRLVDTIRAAHARYGEVRSQDERTRSRERAVAALVEAVDKFEQARGSLKDGEGFWRDLRNASDALLLRARDMAQARSMQARELLFNLQAVDSGAGGSGPAGSAPGAMAVAVPPLLERGVSAGSAGGEYAYGAGGGAPGGGGYGSARSGVPSVSSTASGGGAAGGYASPYGGAGPAGVGHSSSGASMAGGLGHSGSAGGYGGGAPGYGANLATSAGMGAGQHRPDGIPVAQPVYGYGAPQGSGGGQGYGQPVGPGYGYPQGSGAPGGGYPGGGYGQPAPGYGGPAPGQAPYGAQPGGGGGGALAKLEGMGFRRDAADRALAMHGGNFDAALNQLLSQ